MKSKSFLNQNERTLVDELERFYYGFKSQTGAVPPELVLSNRQMNSMRRILEKAKDNPGFEFNDRFDANKKTYRGIPIVELAKMRRYRRRKDMMEMDFE